MTLGEAKCLTFSWFGLVVSTHCSHSNRYPPRLIQGAQVSVFRTYLSLDHFVSMKPVFEYEVRLLFL